MKYVSRNTTIGAGIHRAITSSLGVVALMAVLPAATAAEDEHPHRGHRWVRSHPFTIAGLVRNVPEPFDLEQYLAAGFNSVLAWETSQYDRMLPQVSAAGASYMLNLQKWGDEAANKEGSNMDTMAEGLRELDREGALRKIADWVANPGCIGLTANDEASKPSYLRYTRRLLKRLRQEFPDALAFCNAHPAGHEAQDGGYISLHHYFDEFAAMVDPDIFMTDVYPLGVPGKKGYQGSNGISGNYFELLEAVRKTALEHGMPYWMFIQSFETHGSWERRLPSESDLRVQMFAPLTYGYTGILYFTYDMAYERGLIERTGEPNRLYHAAARANPEVTNLGAAMRFLTSTDVRYVPGTHHHEGAEVANELPGDTKKWESGAGDDARIRSVQVSGSGKGKDGLLGFFRDEEGNEYFMVTNLWHNAEASAEDRTLTITMRFDRKVSRLYRLSRTTGNSETLKLRDGNLEITLPGGTGDLFKYGKQPFPGT